MPRTARIELFPGRDGKWYFHRRATNGKITDPSQGYTTKGNAKRAAKARFVGLPIA